MIGRFIIKYLKLNVKEKYRFDEFIRLRKLKIFSKHLSNYIVYNAIEILDIKDTINQIIIYIKINHISKAQKLIKNKGKIIIPDKSIGCIKLYSPQLTDYACKYNRINLLKFLIQNGYKCNHRTLSYAIEYSNRNIVKLLLELDGIELDKVTKYGKCVLLRGDIQIFTWWYCKSQLDYLDQIFPIMVVKYGTLDMVKLIHSEGHKFMDILTEVAIEYNRYDILVYLIENVKLISTRECVLKAYDSLLNSDTDNYIRNLYDKPNTLNN